MLEFIEKILLSLGLVAGTTLFFLYLGSIVFGFEHKEGMNEWFTGKGYNFSPFNWILVFIIICVFHPDKTNKDKTIK